MECCNCGHTEFTTKSLTLKETFVGHIGRFQKYTTASAVTVAESAKYFGIKCAKCNQIQPKDPEAWKLANTMQRLVLDANHEAELACSLLHHFNSVVTKTSLPPLDSGDTLSNQAKIFYQMKVIEFFKPRGVKLYEVRTDFSYADLSEKKILEENIRCLKKDLGFVRLEDKKEMVKLVFQPHIFPSGFVQNHHQNIQKIYSLALGHILNDDHDMYCDLTGTELSRFKNGNLCLTFSKKSHQKFIQKLTQYLG